MPYIETETVEPVTYTDNGPGGGSGCDENNIRPPKPRTIKKGEPPWEDRTIQPFATVCFYDEKGESYKTESGPISSPNDKVKLLKDGITVEVKHNWLVEALLRELGLSTVNEFLQRVVERDE